MRLNSAKKISRATMPSTPDFLIQLMQETLGGFFFGIAILNIIGAQSPSRSTLYFLASALFFLLSFVCFPSCILWLETKGIKWAKQVRVILFFVLLISGIVAEFFAISWSPY